MNELVVHNAASTAGDDHVVDSLIELHPLGDVLHDVKLRNKTFRLFTTQLKTLLLVPNPEECHPGWDHTSSTSPIRKCFVDHIVSVLPSTLFKEHVAELPTGLVVQAAVVLMNRHIKEEDAVDFAAFDERFETYIEAEDDA